MNILFVCSKNQWRSPTAEALYKNKNGIQVRSAGTEPSARIRINENHLKWADIIFVMEKKHKQRLIEKFSNCTKQIIVLDIPDEFSYMDPDLIEEIKSKVDFYLTQN